MSASGTGLFPSVLLPVPVSFFALSGVALFFALLFAAPVIVLMVIRILILKIFILQEIIILQAVSVCQLVRAGVIYIDLGQIFLIDYLKVVIEKVTV